MSLAPGRYKVLLTTDGLFKSPHYLTVSIKNKTRYIQLDNGVPQKEDDILEQLKEMRLEVVKMINGDITVTKANIRIEWLDEDGDKFSSGKMSSVYLVRDLFTQFPPVAKALGSRQASKRK